MIKSISVVVPVYNEQAQIQVCLSRVSAYLNLIQTQWEIIVSSDGSTDQTLALTRDFIDKHPNENIRVVMTEINQGKGSAVRRAVLASQYELILVTDVDLSSPIKEVEKLANAIESGYDAAIGSRALRSVGADVKQSFKRTLSGRIFNFFVRSLILDGFHDTQCGFKLFTRKAALELFSRQRLLGFSFDVEILYLAALHKLKVKEVPVMWSQGGDSKVRLVRDSSRMVRDLVYLRKIYKKRLCVR